MKNLILILLLGIWSCQPSVDKDKPDLQRILISSETRVCTGVSPMECLQVKWNKDQEDWELFYDHIQGFDYVKGYEYELIVKVEKVENPPADASSLKYTLVKEVSRTAHK